MKNNHRSRVMGGHRTFFMLFGVAAGILAVVRYRHPEYSLKVQSKIAVWQAELSRSFGAGKAAGIASRIRKNYYELMAGRPEFEYPVLRGHLEEHILPGLALYQVLQDVLQEPEEVLEWTSALLRLTVLPQKMRYSLLGRSPRFYSLMSFVMPKLIERNYPVYGWQSEWIENSDRRVAFHMHSCFYLDVLKAYGVPELTPCFCQLDDALADELSPYVCWKRGGTLAGGDEYCDFQYIHVNPME